MFERIVHRVIQAGRERGKEKPCAAKPVRSAHRPARRAMASALAACLMLTMLPTAAFAADTDTGKVIQIGTDSITGPVRKGTSNPIQYIPTSYIYYGGGEDPIKWQVLSTEGNGGTYFRGEEAVTASPLLLFSEYLLDAMCFSNQQEDGPIWQGSAAQTWCGNFADTALTTTERAAVLTTTKQDIEEKIFGKDWRYPWGTSEEKMGLSKDTVFFLSAREVYDYIGASGIPGLQARKIGDSSGWYPWWLRSPCDGLYYGVGRVNNGGYVGLGVNNNAEQARPAFNLDTAHVLFISAADNRGHSSSLSSTADYDGNEWKITLKDMNDFSSDASLNSTFTTQGSGLTLTHASLSSFQDAEYTNVTAMLTDPDGSVLYYGSINTDVSATSSTITIPGNVPAGSYTLSVYGEDWNNAYQTDYATGTPFTSTITVAPTYVISLDPATDKTFDTAIIGYADQTPHSVTVSNTGNQATGALTVALSGTNSGSFTLSTASISSVAVGGNDSFTVRPNTGLSAGTYTATVTVSGGNSISESFDVSFTVSNAPITNHTVTSTLTNLTITGANSVVNEQTYTATLQPANGYKLPDTITVTMGTSTLVVDSGYTYNCTSGEISISSVTGDVVITAVGVTTIDDSSGNGNSGYTPPSIVTKDDQPGAPTTAQTDVAAKTDGKGGTIATVPGSAVDSAVAKAQAAAKKNGTEGNGVAVQVHVTSSNTNTNTVTVNLPKATQEKLISHQVSNFTLVVDQPDISISLNLESVKEIHQQANADVQLSVTRMTDTGSLSAEARAAIGNRPVFQFSASYRGGKITNFGDGNVSIDFPYTLQAGELAGSLYAVYVDDNGKVTYLTNSSYDFKEKVLRFATDHFSVYGIGYKTPSVTFDDIQNHWAKEDIEFVAARGILNGTGSNQFSPDAPMTRAMFVVALGRMAGIDPSGYASGTFSDVPGTAYYAPYVEWAASKDIVVGTGGGKFSPDGLVTRQQMAAIMSRYAKAMGYQVPATRTAVTFADNSAIGSWAADAVRQMQRAGVLMGKGGNRFDPTGTATRAQASATIRRYIELVIDWQSTQGWTQNDSAS